jgi:hypothetical protein
VGNRTKKENNTVRRVENLRLHTDRADERGHGVDIRCGREITSVHWVRLQPLHVRPAPAADSILNNPL